MPKWTQSARTKTASRQRLIHAVELMEDFRMLRRHSVHAAAAVLLLAVLGGCSGSSSESGNPTSQGAPGAGDPSGGGVETGEAASVNAAEPAKATCDQLAVAEVQPMVSNPVTKAAPRSIGPNDSPGQGCDFDTDEDGTAVEVIILSGSYGRQAFASDVKEQGADAVAVSGVGSKASRKKGEIGLSATNGSLYCSVSAEAADMPEVGDWESAHGSTSSVPDSIVGPAVNVVGTLCNRIFGSGNTTPDLAALKSAVADAN